MPAGAISASSPRVVLKYRLPWAEVVTDLNDTVKSLTAGYASVDWLPGDYQRADVVKVDILVNAKPVDALCFVAHKDRAVSEGRRVAAKLKSVISRQQFEIVIQAAVGSKVFAKERLAPFRKDVLTKGGKTVGGGDRSRKEKLLQKQREGKKRMKTVRASCWLSALAWAASLLVIVSPMLSLSPVTPFSSFNNCLPCVEMIFSPPVCRWATCSSARRPSTPS